MAQKRASTRWKRPLENHPIKAPLINESLARFKHVQVNKLDFLSYCEIITIRLTAALRQARASAQELLHSHLVPWLCGQSILFGLHYHTLH